MMRDEIINYLIKENNFKSYLEIGVYDGKNLEKIDCEFKVGVDPDRKTKATVFATSDEFFSSNRKEFDLIFIDGLHHKDQVIKDINNSLNTLAENGVIVLHDVNPTSEKMQSVPRLQGEWTGDVYKAFLHFRQREDLSMCCINTDYGVGIIKRGNQLPLTVKNPSYSGLEKNRKYWLNLVSVNEYFPTIPDISICIPAFEQYGHGVKNLTHLLKSIEKQNGNFEVIVSDNSKDESIYELCMLFNEKTTLGIKYFKNEKTGISENTNHSMKQATAEFIKIMYMDDVFLDNNAIKEFVHALRTHEWVTSYSKAIDQFNIPYKSHVPKWDDNILFGHNSIGMPSMLAVRKNEFEFDVNLKTRLDCDYMYQLNKKFGKIHVIPKFLIGQRFWHGSTSRVQGNHTVSEVGYLREKHNL